MAGIMNEIFGAKIRKDGSCQSLKDRCATDFQLFCETYLSNSFTSPWSIKFHGWMIKKIEEIIFEHKDDETRTVIAAPRGHAKSTTGNFAQTLWHICYKHKKNIVIISATSDVSKQFLGMIKNELEYNERIRDDFGDLTGSDIWNNSSILTSNGVYVTSKSAGTQVRGMNFNGTRPDMVILDDLETPEQVKSPSLTEELETWFNSDVMPMGSTTCDYFYVGTVLSYKSLLWHMLKEGRYSMWTRKIFQAVISFSASPLWEEWRDIMLDLERGDSAYDYATKFYNKNKAEMLCGTEVLWPDQRKDMYKHLMERQLASEEGFASEYQNDPQTESTRIFKMEWIENNYYVDTPDIKEVCIAIDPAVAGRRNSDYSVIMVVGKGKDNYFYVLDADLQKRKPDKLIEDCKTMIAKYYQYKPKVVVETNQMQQFFSSTLQADMVKSGIYLDWIEITHKSGDSKAARIESLVPHVKNGYIKFKASHHILIGQLKNYPKVHDDGPDALEMAIKPLMDSARRVFGFGSMGTGNIKKADNSNFSFLKSLGINLKDR